MPEFFRSETIGAPILQPYIPDGTYSGVVANRAELFPRIQSGEIDHLDFKAMVFKTGLNKNFYRFNPEELGLFAASFVEKPFLRDHNERNIEAREGTILQSQFYDDSFYQVIRLTTRKGMLALLEGQIDRFSIGWFFEEVTCSICESDFRSCQHWPGRKYKLVDKSEKVCEIIFSGLSGKEVSAVNVPAVDGTQILASLKNTRQPELLPEAASPVPNDLPRMLSTGVIREVATSSPFLFLGDRALRSHEAPNKEKELMTMAILNTNPPSEDPIPAESENSIDILKHSCSIMLQMALEQSGLPHLVKARLERQFADQVFQASTLTTEINAARDEVAALAAPGMIKGPGRVTGMNTTDDQLQAAVQDLFAVDRDPGLEEVKPAKLSGIRELYILTTGDREFHGGYHPDNIHLATTADFTGLVKNALNKSVVRQWEAMGRAGYDWWKAIVKVEHFETLNTITGILTGTVGALSTVAEQGEYTELEIGDSPETADFVKYGNYIPLTLELIDRDETRKLKQYPIELANAAIRNVSKLIAAVFTDNAGVGPTMADSGALFNATAVTTAGGHANLLTTALAAAQWDVVAAAMYNQPMLIKNAAGLYGTGSKMAIEPRFCLVPRALRKTAFDAFLNAWDVTDNKHAENLLKGNVVPLVVPEWTDANDWAAVIDPTIVPGIIVGERFGLMPEIFIANRETDPAVFMNDEHRLKVRHFLAILVQDFRPLHKSNVA